MKKQKRSHRMARSIGIGFAVLALLALLGMNAAILWLLTDSQGALVPARAIGKVEELAGRLRAEGLDGHALEEYEAGLRLAGIGAHARARFAYLAGNIAFEDQADFEKALGFYERALFYDSHPPLDLKRSIAGRIEECRRRLGLRSGRGGPDAPTSASLSMVVGAVEDRNVTLGQIDAAIRGLSPSDQARFSDPAAKREFTRWYVAQEALASEARDRGLSNDAEVLLAVGRSEKDALARRLLELESQAKVRVEPDEVAGYYAAHEAEFNTPKKVMAAHILLPDDAGARMVAKRLEGGADFAALARDLSRDEATRRNGGLLGWVFEAATLQASGPVDSMETAKAILALNPGEVSPPVPGSRGVHLYKAMEAQPARHRTLEEARGEIAGLLRREKEERLEETLTQRVMRSRDARVVDEAFLGVAPASAPLQR